MQFEKPEPQGFTIYALVGCPASEAATARIAELSAKIGAPMKHHAITREQSPEFKKWLGGFNVPILTAQDTFPVIFIDTLLIGGNDDLGAFLNN